MVREYICFVFSSQSEFHLPLTSKVSDSIPARQSGHIDGSVSVLQSLDHSHDISGEQSVGKSYALNHFVDTSFAGSAMRCTEGVWLSVTPTQDALIVSMDFEGNVI